MTGHSRGDVVLIGFVFSDESGKKFRPALVLSSSAYHRGRQEVVVAAITSNIRRRLAFSLVTGILRTVKRTMIDRKLGTMPKSDMVTVDREIRRSLGL